MAELTKKMARKTAEIANTYCDDIYAELYERLGDKRDKVYCSGFLDGADNVCYNAFMAGARYMYQQMKYKNGKENKI